MAERYLFRGKRLDEGGWATGYFRINLNGESKIYYPRDGGRAHYVNPATIGQCTGLRGKDGMLIFEGDIVGSHHRFTVTWDQDGWWLVHSKKEVPAIPLVSVAEYHEIVGNIHDTPELLEVHHMAREESGHTMD
ncbi:MAG: YopX family protein [Oscillospiraceae bacterium]|nr:YopX family protein [Oscillospiraceae bacterium]